MRTRQNSHGLISIRAVLWGHRPPVAGAKARSKIVVYSHFYPTGENATQIRGYPEQLKN